MLEKIIREQTGLGTLCPQHISWLQLLVKVAFKVKCAGLIFYANKGKHIIYLFPTNEPNQEFPRKSKPILKSSFDENIAKANSMLNELLEKSDFFSSLIPYYKIKIVHTLPAKVLKSELLNADQTS